MNVQIKVRLDENGKMVFEEAHKNEVRIQGVGWQPAKAAKELKKGDVTMWNGGYKDEVVNVIPSKTGKTVVVMLKDGKSGETYPRKMGADRLVAIV